MSIPTTITFATHNLGKAKEVEKLFSSYKTQILTLAEFTSTKADETALSFIENAIIKANHALEFSTNPVLADDSGLVVPALSGKPGVLSARFAGENASDSENNSALINAIKNAELEFPQPAYFYCALIFKRYKTDPIVICTHSKLLGYILETPAGDNGFGYDPIFYVPQFKKTLAEVSIEEKNSLSHRSNAIKKLIDILE